MVLWLVVGVMRRALRCRVRPLLRGLGFEFEFVCWVCCAVAAAAALVPLHVTASCILARMAF